MIQFNNNESFSMQKYARIGGLLYVVIIILGISSEFFFRGKLIVSGNPEATAMHIQANPSLWRIGIVAEYISIICTIILAMIYFFLLRPVHRKLNLLATFFRMVSIIVQIIAILNLIDVLFYLDNSNSLKSFTLEQCHAMAAICIKSHSYGYGISLLFLGCCFLVHGYLIYRSEFLPKVLGLLIQLAGICYISNGFILILAPKVSGLAFQLFFLPVFIAETSLGLWLLIKGINVEKWELKYNQAT
ncbi:DUF4386 domain-containing protein [Ferruginibacter albus]|uniref:DUF4386 domain-containing protein n=1 Tax=Ferruginibacter albus TaxID=2875540 RepID=UPI001CC3D951|nr:DUF4386 domain-containing protein [Ferruginibacter albus]UAY53060.1 DUF4386 domain-containing protein [Ferruginibacter albus]